LDLLLIVIMLSSQETSDLDEVKAEKDNMISIETGKTDVISQYVNDINKVDCDADLGDFALDDDSIEEESAEPDTSAGNFLSTHNS